MNCFVIMPFQSEFDDVYDQIKFTVAGVATNGNFRCFRLDESRPAGRITDRLVSELRSATLCIADLTGTKPNVMWELGYAMALHKPTIIVTQNAAELPFDVKDMQCIEYSRDRLARTLAPPLRASLTDTLRLLEHAVPAVTVIDQQNDRIGQLLDEVSQLRAIVGEVVASWKAGEPPAPSAPAEDMYALTGNWVNTESNSHMYSRIVNGEVLTPYCYIGNKAISGVYYGWRKIGDHWFARYQWLEADISGFSFLRMDEPGRMTGAWWTAGHFNEELDVPPTSSGVPSTWERQEGTDLPKWAEQFFRNVEDRGLAPLLPLFRR